MYTGTKPKVRKFTGHVTTTIFDKKPVKKCENQTKMYYQQSIMTW